MARPLRLEYPGSLWHITSRGNARQPIFRDDDDRRRYLDLLGLAVARFAWILTAYALMPNHVHLVVQLTADTLSRGMQWLNAAYASAFNRRHDRVGHLFQGRFNACLVEKETYLLEVLRYVVLNPVRANLVEHPADYEWTSYRAVTGTVPPPEWLAVDDVLINFGDERERARRRFGEFVEAGIGIENCPWNDVSGQIFLGSDTWIDTVRKRVALRPRSDEHPAEQRRIGHFAIADIVMSVARTLEIHVDAVRRKRVPRLIAVWLAKNEALLTNREIAAGLRLRSEGYVSDLVRASEKAVSNHGMQLWVDACLSTLRGQ